MKRVIWLRVAAAIIIVALLYAIILMPPPMKPHPPNDDPWVLVSYKPDARYGTYLGNGFIACRIKGDGVGSQDGKPLPCFMAGLYDNEKLIPTPTWSDLRFYDGKTEFRIDPHADYKQTLNMKTGILTTHATWRAGGKTLRGEIEVIVSRAEPNIGLVRATLTPDFHGRLRVEAPMPHDSAQLLWWATDSTESEVYETRKQAGRYVAVAGWLQQIKGPGTPRRVMVPDAERYWATVRAVAGKGFAVCSINAVAFANGERRLAVDRAYGVLLQLSGSRLPPDLGEHPTVQMNSVRAGVDAVVVRHKAAWAKLWERDIIIDGPKKDQQVLHSCMFYILQSVREGSEWSIPPMGLSDNAFSGHVFWDADLWIFPALILQHPELAKSIVEYRYKTLPGAIANAKASGNAGAEYAWESGYTGKEDTPPGLSYRHERHINGDVALAQWQYYLATGDLAWLRTRGYPVIKATADYWTTRATFVPAKNRYEILRVVPPDENAEVINNSAYTNCIAQMNLRIAQQAAKLISAQPNPKWAVVADKMHIPFDRSRGIFTAHDNYKGYEAKQADTELLIYPLQYQLPGADMNSVYRKVFAFYAPKVMRVGPAMSTSVHSVISARLGDPQRAYDYFLKSYKPYLRGPFNYFNEKPSKIMDSMCFLTGAAGPIQATLFGMAQTRMDYLGPNSGSLTWRPHLPKQWKSLKITGVQWRGKTFDITARPR